MIVKNIIKMLLIFSLPFMLSCSKKANAPCVKELDCDDCTCLFEKLQQNLHDPQTAQKIQECYNKACK